MRGREGKHEGGGGAGEGGKRVRMGRERGTHEERRTLSLNR